MFESDDRPRTHMQKARTETSDGSCPRKACTMTRSSARPAVVHMTRFMSCSIVVRAAQRMQQQRYHMISCRILTTPSAAKLRVYRDSHLLSNLTSSLVFRTKPLSANVNRDRRIRE